MCVCASLIIVELFNKWCDDYKIIIEGIIDCILNEKVVPPHSLVNGGFKHK